MTRLDVRDARTHLDHLLEQVEAGEEIELTRDGRPVARLVPYQASRKSRRPGLWKSRVWIADDFDATVPELQGAFDDTSP